MGRAPCCDKASVKRGPWSREEDAALKDYIEKHGTGGNWLALPQKAGLRRCGKSCRLRWLNYLRPNIKHGDFTDFEDGVICTLYATIGSRWSVIAAQLPGRTDNDIKNYFNTKLKKKLMAQTALISPYSLPRLNSHGLQIPSPALPSLSASPSSYSLSPADLQWPSTHDGINFENPMQHYQVKKGGSPITHGGGGSGGEATCSSSEAKHNFSSSSSATGVAADSDQAVSYDYCPYRAVEEQENSSGSGGGWTQQAVADKGWGENAVIADHDYGFEQIMQLIISNNSTCSFLFDENKVGGSEYY